MWKCILILNRGHNDALQCTFFIFDIMCNAHFLQFKTAGLLLVKMCVFVHIIHIVGKLPYASLVLY